jgi:hypothetical protein
MSWEHVVGCQVAKAACIVRGQSAATGDPAGNAVGPDYNKQWLLRRIAFKVISCLAIKLHSDASDNKVVQML